MKNPTAHSNEPQIAPQTPFTNHTGGVGGGTLAHLRGATRSECVMIFFESLEEEEGEEEEKREPTGGCRDDFVL